jgi:hypothetical protein
MYGVESPMWIRVSRQHFDGPAKSWIHSINAALGRNFAKSFMTVLIETNMKFSFANSFQSNSPPLSPPMSPSFLSWWVDQFSAYSTTTDPLYYTMQFIDGLKPEIRAVVLMQCPKDLDTACTLTLL